MKEKLSRRSFLKTGAFATLGMTIAPTVLLGKEATSTALSDSKFPSPKNSEISLDDGTTVYGYVGTSKGPVAGVMVSDGVEVTVTNENGIYQLASEKELGYVFMSVPSGYEVGSNGVLPLHYHLLRNLPNHKERVDFRLIPKKGQDAFKVFMLGDIHLVRDYRGAIGQFRMFTDDLNAYMAAHKKENMYAIALGDMTWDLYWQRPDDIFFPDYLEEVNNGFTNLQIYHTMGNHDNDWQAYNDLDAEKPYTQYIAPSYYSFNIGKVHFIVLDNIDCSKHDGTLKRGFTETFTDRQLEWLKKDLALIDKNTPLIITTHAQIFWPDTPDKFAFNKPEIRQENSQKFLNIVKDYKVHLVTGHSHLIFNVTPDDEVVRGMDFYEHNSGAVCASWWFSEYYTPGVNIARDGAPAGYGIWDIDGTDIKYVFKGYGLSEDVQFRTYDLNNVCFTMDDVPNMDKTRNELVEGWKKYCDAYPKNSDNEVLINVWNWNRYWKLQVVDDKGNELPYEPVFAYDPLHILALSLPEFNESGADSPYPSFITDLWTHFFKVKTYAPDTNLNITVTDEFGNVYTEKMIRPKAFTANIYARH